MGLNRILAYLCVECTKEDELPGPPVDQNNRTRTVDSACKVVAANLESRKWDGSGLKVKQFARVSRC